MQDNCQFFVKKIDDHKGPREIPVHRFDRSLAIFGGMLNFMPIGEAGPMDDHAEPIVRFC
jgi:hypothetical protein